MKSFRKMAANRLSFLLLLALILWPVMTQARFMGHEYRSETRDLPGGMCQVCQFDYYYFFWILISIQENCTVHVCITQPAFPPEGNTAY